MGINKLKELAALISPPPNPRSHIGDWGAIEVALRFALPTDYKEFIQLYGSGIFQPSRLWVINPFQDGLDTGWLTEEIERVRGYGVDFPFSAAPAPSGLLPWGLDDYGNYFCWQVKGSLDEWDIILCADYCKKSSRIQGYSMSQLLCDLFQGRFPQPLIDIPPEMYEQRQRFEIRDK